MDLKGGRHCHHGICMTRKFYSPYFKRYEIWKETANFISFLFYT